MKYIYFTKLFTAFILPDLYYRQNIIYFDKRTLLRNFFAIKYTNLLKAYSNNTEFTFAFWSVI